MARFSSRHAFRPNRFGSLARIFNVLSDLQANRFEELNNYSGLMTRRKYDDSPRASAGHVSTASAPSTPKLPAMAPG
jgi:hypothetical protein